MSSGSIPFHRYHRTNALGEGSFGSVVTVYNDDGEEYAMKLFLPEEDDEEEEEEDEPTIEVGALLEISILRLLRESNGHTNIVPLVDIQGGEDDDYDEDGGGGGAGTAGCLGMTMPFYPMGSLYQAIQDNQKIVQSKQSKIAITHGILSAVHHLHRNGIMHRDIKSDNIVLAPTTTTTDGFKPVLIDFSLVKIVDGTLWGKPNSVVNANGELQEEEEKGASCLPSTTPRHNRNNGSRDEVFAPFFTGGVGTPMYIAPEVYENEPYGRLADVWSIGVVLLEVLQKQVMPDIKTSQALTYINEALTNKIPHDKPFPTLARHLLQQEVDQRWSTTQALEYMSQTFGTAPPPTATTRTINIKEALPFDNQQEEEEEENVEPMTTTTTATPGKKKQPNKKKKKKDPVLERRWKKVQQLCRELECDHPLTAQAAICYVSQMVELDEDLDDIDSSQSMLDCVLLAQKIFEVEMITLRDVPEKYPKSFANWDYDTYRDNESTLFLMLDYCLYPRELLMV